MEEIVISGKAGDPSLNEMTNLKRLKRAAVTFILHKHNIHLHAKPATFSPPRRTACFYRGTPCNVFIFKWKSQEFISYWSSIHSLLSKVYLSEVHVMQQRGGYIPSQAANKGEKVRGRQAASFTNRVRMLWLGFTGSRQEASFFKDPDFTSILPSARKVTDAATWTSPPHELRLDGLAYWISSSRIPYGNPLHRWHRTFLSTAKSKWNSMSLV